MAVWMKFSVAAQQSPLLAAAARWGGGGFAVSRVD